MKTVKLNISLLLMLFGMTTLSAQYYIDAENASFDSKRNLKDNGRTFYFHKEGPGVITPWLSGIKRRGSKSIGLRLNGSNSGLNKQRNEYAIIQWKNPQNVRNGDKKYTGFSFLLAKDAWTSPRSWFGLHQVQQVPIKNQVGNFAFISLAIGKDNMLTLTAAHGQNGNTQNRPSVRRNSRNIFKAKPGVWYDVVIGWRFRPFNADGWLICWIKTASESNYKMYPMKNIKVGYTEPAKQIQNNKIGMYRGRVPYDNKMYIDEIRWAGYFNGAKIPGSGAKEISTEITTNSEYILSPNPVRKNDDFSITLDQLNDEPSATIEVRNVLGQLLTTKQINVSNGDEVQLNLNTLNINNSGVYLVRIAHGNSIKTKKIVVE